MCGICLVFNIPIDQHHFNFSFFHSYNPSSEAELLPLNQHIQSHKLQLPPPPDLCTIQRVLAQRGPNKVVAHQIDMYKTNFQVISAKDYDNHIEKGNALGVQSTLHLRGFHSYTP
jgi:hypothetical protein